MPDDSILRLEYIYYYIRGLLVGHGITSAHRDHFGLIVKFPKTEENMGGFVVVGGGGGVTIALAWLSERRPGLDPGLGNASTR